MLNPGLYQENQAELVTLMPSLGHKALFRVISLHTLCRFLQVACIIHIYVAKKDYLIFGLHLIDISVGRNRIAFFCQFQKVSPLEELSGVW